jgi:hypothetical protein
VQTRDARKMCWIFVLFFLLMLGFLCLEDWIAISRKLIMLLVVSPPVSCILLCVENSVV